MFSSLRENVLSDQEGDIAIQSVFMWRRSRDSVSFIDECATTDFNWMPIIHFPDQIQLLDA
jgi:hypothetical protein